MTSLYELLNSFPVKLLTSLFVIVCRWRMLAVNSPAVLFFCYDGNNTGPVGV